MEERISAKEALELADSKRAKYSEIKSAIYKLIRNAASDGRYSCSWSNTPPYNVYGNIHRKDLFRIAEDLDGDGFIADVDMQDPIINIEWGNEDD